MDSSRRAESLISYLRWLVAACGLSVAGEHMTVWQVVAVAGLVVAYNGAVSWCAFSDARFRLYGRALSLAARVLDIAVITFLVARSSSFYSPASALYWFVLVTTGYTGGSLRRLASVTVISMVASACAGFLGLRASADGAEIVTIILARSAVVFCGALVAAFIRTSRKHDEMASERFSYLHAIHNCGAKLTTFRSVHEMVLHVLEVTITKTHTAGAQLLLVDEESHELVCEGAFAPVSDTQASAQSAQATGPDERAIRSYAEWVVKSRREFLMRVGGKGSEENSDAANDRSVIAVPLVWQSSGIDDDVSVQGVMLVWGYPNQDINEDALHIVRIFAAMSAAAIVNLRLYTNLQKSFLRTLQSLAKGLEARDEYTQGHSERVMRVACLLASELDCNPETVELLRNASLLHDIGKIGVPDAILRKPGKLTSEEWETMRRHPLVSEEICRPLGLSEEILFLVKHHHERLDGKGYPDGLDASEQPLLQRILVVADAFDAMRSRRPYRDIMPIEDLRAELNRCAGRAMDPTVVCALLGLMEIGETDAIYEEHDRKTGFLVCDITEEDQRKAA
jgi:putative nucleotidyltransferase with HDIG domain